MDEQREQVSHRATAAEGRALTALTHEEAIRDLRRKTGLTGSACAVILELAAIIEERDRAIHRLEARPAALGQQQLHLQVRVPRIDAMSHQLASHQHDPHAGTAVLPMSISRSLDAPEILLGPARHKGEPQAPRTTWRLQQAAAEAEA